MTSYSLYFFSYWYVKQAKLSEQKEVNFSRRLSELHLSAPTETIAQAEIFSSETVLEVLMSAGTGSGACLTAW